MKILLYTSGRTGSHYLFELMQSYVGGHWSEATFGLPKPYTAHDLIDWYDRKLQTNSIVCGKVSDVHLPILSDIDLPSYNHLYLYREDTLRQAISWYRAAKTKRWFPWQPPAPDPPFDPLEILRLQRIFLAQNKAFYSFFCEQQLKPFHMVYEDMIHHPARFARGLASFLNGTPLIPNPVLPTRCVPMSDSLTERWYSVLTAQNI